MAQDDARSGPAHPLIESDHVEGTAVYDAKGEQVGTIKRLVIEKLSGHVVYAVTEFGGFLGLGSEMHTVPWDQLHYDTALSGYKTNITADWLRNAPEFSRRDDALLSGHECDELDAYYRAMLE
jgi:hypothetical protein